MPRSDGAHRIIRHALMKPATIVPAKSPSHFFALFASLSSMAVTSNFCGGAVMLQRSIRLAFLFVLSVSGAIASLSSNAFAQAQPVSQAPTAASYVLGPNDRVRLKVYGEPDIAGEYEIDSNG